MPSWDEILSQIDNPKIQTNGDIWQEMYSQNSEYYGAVKTWQQFSIFHDILVLLEN